MPVIYRRLEQVRSASGKLLSCIAHNVLQRQFFFLELVMRPLLLSLLRLYS